MKLAMFRAGCSLAVLALGISAAAAAETIRIAEHRQARIDALMQSVPAIEAKLGVEIEVVEYPAPEKDYLSKILTELRAGNAPDIFTANSDARRAGHCRRRLCRSDHRSGQGMGWLRSAV